MNTELVRTHTRTRTHAYTLAHTQSHTHKLAQAACHLAMAFSCLRKSLFGMQSGAGPPAAPAPTLARCSHALYIASP